jgi:hypothetical protein
MLVTSAAKKSTARPIPAGWALDAILQCDEAHAGFHTFVCRASNLRRQAVFMALSQLERSRPEVLASCIKRGSTRAGLVDADPVSIIARGLMCIRLKDLVQAIFGSPAEGIVPNSPMTCFSFCTTILRNDTAPNCCGRSTGSRMMWLTLFGGCPRR